MLQLEAVLVTAGWVLGPFCLALLFLRWLLSGSSGQHGNAGDGALSVSRLRQQLEEEGAALAYGAHATSSKLASVHSLRRPGGRCDPVCCSLDEVA
ncbi:hypothetical protein [Saccharothrix australiensis]|uniref:Uncharacterized protein n=1 Tax=Saccharothrix australiensis TaxID=2072 RepID=A0A495VV37_9PSEU|nr:hypothetical protein [Saccharothrix australiensis]RKT52225.1 hypothetical protein C8E97_0732 [Saccharothrix australiensis]